MQNVTIVKYDNNRGGCSYKIIVDGKVIYKGIIYYQINSTLRSMNLSHAINPMYDDCRAMVAYPITEGTF